MQCAARLEAAAEFRRPLPVEPFSADERQRRHRNPEKAEMSHDHAAKDALGCARYLKSVRSGDDWSRFDAAVGDYLAKHKNGISTSTLRKMLASGFQLLASADKDGINRILAATRM
jgi:hypothetical protein